MLVCSDIIYNTTVGPTKILKFVYSPTRPIRFVFKIEKDFIETFNNNNAKFVKRIVKRAHGLIG